MVWLDAHTFSNTHLNKNKTRTYRGDMGIVPGVVVHNDRAVGHGRHLVPVVPPRQDLGVGVGVLFKEVCVYVGVFMCVWYP